MMLSAKQRLLRRAALELQDGMTVNLGIGLPSGILPFVSSDTKVCLHSENGISGVGDVLPLEDANRNLIDAGGNYINTRSGSAFFDSATSFAIARSGRLHLSILGAFQVAQNGDLANWVIPGKFTPGAGGAIELAQKAKRLVILTMHQDKYGNSKLVENCSLPLTASMCVDRIYTDKAVIDITGNGMRLMELAKGQTINSVVDASNVDLIIPDGDIPSF